VLEVHPGDDVARIHLAQTLEDQGHVSDAMETYVTWLRKEPHDTVVRDAAESFVARHAREIAGAMAAQQREAGNP